MPETVQKNPEQIMKRVPMMKKNRFELLQNLTMITQVGFSLITPLLVCLGVCWWLTRRFDLGGWIFIPGFILGLGGSFSAAWKLYQSAMRREKKKKEKEKETLSFNQHI